ncbi:MAG TPA: metallophosphoesterase, partial [Acidimicrobiia bacterium]|nr:metallophosphoesterase [Acidimicrobiia bacterium]
MGRHSREGRPRLSVVVGAVAFPILLLTVASAAMIPSSPAGALEPTPEVLVGAGDISTCSTERDEATAQLLDDIPGTVATFGDGVYPDGTIADYTGCYDPTWGRHKARTRPSSGNHDYHTPGAAGYFEYFGAAAGTPGQGYYSYDLGGWHVLVLNSECLEVGGCDPASPQGQWLQADLAASANPCKLAYWHKPLFSSGFHGGESGVRPLWAALYAAGADVILNGHDHIYERFARQDPNGAADSASGIRQFTVGTGGAGLTSVVAVQPNSELRNETDHGVLKLSLQPGRYDWEFVPIAGLGF